MRATGVLSQPRGALAALALGLLLAGCGSAPKPAPDRPSSARARARRPTATASVPTCRPTSPACPTPSRGSSRSAPAARTSRTRCSAATTCRSPATAPSSERGLASWYGKKFHGRRTANGETYDMYAMTAAHPTLPLPSYARIRNPANGREVVVRINDRGPFHAGRIVDLSYAAALRLDLLRGVAPVELERLTFDEIRAGIWRRGDAEATRLAERDAQRAARRRATAAAAAPVPVPADAVVPVATLPAETAEEPAATAASGRRRRSPRLPCRPWRRRAARLLGAARRLSRVGRRRELPAAGRRRGRVAGAAARDLRRRDPVPGPGRALSEPGRSAGRRGACARSARAGAGVVERR